MREMVCGLFADWIGSLNTFGLVFLLGVGGVRTATSNLPLTRTQGLLQVIWWPLASNYGSIIMFAILSWSLCIPRSHLEADWFPRTYRCLCQYVNATAIPLTNPTDNHDSQAADS